MKKMPVVFCALSLFLGSLGEANAQSLKIQYEDEPLVTVPMTSIVVDEPILINGQFVLVPMNLYTATHTIPDSSNPELIHKVSGEIKIPLTNVGNFGEYILKEGAISAETALGTPGPRKFHVEISVPTVAYTNVFLQGGGNILLTTNVDGGSVNCSNESNEIAGLMYATLDGTPPLQFSGFCFLFYCPFFNLGVSGPNTVGISSALSFTCPSLVPNSLTSSVGMVFNPKVTPGDKAVAKIFQLIAAKPPCVGDLNLDEKVDGADLGILLSNWGSWNDAGDLNFDGTIDGTDLGLILSAFGSCP